ncbi:MAG: hypothetical protein ACREOZ_01670 [Gloeomargaritales cyanobacterium]
MAINAFFAWNHSAEKKSLHRNKLSNAKFYLLLAEEMVEFRDEHTVENVEEGLLDDHHIHGHTMIGIEPSSRPYCIVCKFEENMRRATNMIDVRGKGSRSKRCLIKCESCDVATHFVKMDHDREIMKLPQFETLSCYHIFHHPDCNGLWTTNSQRASPTEGRERKPQAWSINTSHTIYKLIREKYGLGEKKRKSKN